ncbi:unnamed protein product [Protopolystoma xenopodis]|uniref:Uncharacterized protein n=1 Tax=Protopolystoma xenopodis TaxID=117903 RepID=A0A3S5BC33_9PLAT|nr:unnamed protein product [Protopolystoma xenopodis]
MLRTISTRSINAGGRQSICAASAQARIPIFGLPAVRWYKNASHCALAGETASRDRLFVSDLIRCLPDHLAIGRIRPKNFANSPNPRAYQLVLPSLSSATIWRRVDCSTCWLD